MPEPPFVALPGHPALPAPAPPPPVLGVPAVAAVVEL